MQHFQTKTTTAYPSALLSNPSCDPLTEHEAYNKADDLREEATNASLNDGDGHTIAEAEQGHDAAPVDVSITEQPTIHHNRQLCQLHYAEY